MNKDWVEVVFLAIAALVVLGVGLIVTFLVGFWGAVMVVHGENSGWFVLLIALSCFAGALRLFAALLP